MWLSGRALTVSAHYKGDEPGARPSYLLTRESSTFGKICGLTEPDGHKFAILATQLVEARGLQVQGRSWQLSKTASQKQKVKREGMRPRDKALSMLESQVRSQAQAETVRFGDWGSLRASF